MPFDIQGARQAGASDEQIAQYLQQSQPKFDVQGAVKAGASLEQISSELENPSKSQTPSKMDAVISKAKEIGSTIADPTNLIPGVAPYRALREMGKVGSAAMNKSQEGYDLMGNMAAESIDKGGQHPYLSSAVGGTIQNIPNAVNAAAMLESAPELAAALKGAFEKSGEVVSGGVDKLRNLARILTGPGQVKQQIAAKALAQPAQESLASAQEALQQSKQIPTDLTQAKQSLQQFTSDARTPLPIPEELTQAKQDLAQVPANMSKLQAQREALVSKAGANIGELEKPLGPLDSEKIANLIADPKKAATRLQQLTRIGSQGSDYVAQNMSASEIRTNRQFLQQMANHPDVSLQSPQASQMNTVFGEAMDKHIPGYKDALDLYKTAQQALEDIPNIKAQELAKGRSTVQGLQADYKNMSTKYSQVQNEGVARLKTQVQAMQDAFTNSKLNAADAVKKAQLNAKQIMAQADKLVDQGKLSDLARGNLYKGILATGILGGASATVSHFLH